MADLIPAARNARTHSDAQVAQIAASMRRWGWTNPVLVDEASRIIAGHGRVLAAQTLGWTEAPVMVAVGWSEDERRAYLLADNQLALNAGWDLQLLGEEWGALKAGGFDMDLLGFDDIDGLLRGQVKAGRTDPDEVPEAPAVPVSVAGDVWVLGAHRLVCGDSRDAAVVAAALGGAKPHLMVTDPPYGVEYDANWRARAGINMRTAASGKVLNDDRSDWRDAWSMFPGDVAYVWHAGLHSREVQASIEAVGFEIRSQIIWAKQHLVIGRGDYHWQHEPCWYAVRKGAKGRWAGDRKQTTLWHIDKPIKSETGHSTQKPVECMRRPIENNSRRGNAIYEPFNGSGTSIIAAEMTDRVCHAIELNPAYVDVAVERWQNFTGEVAVHEASGAAFADRKAALLQAVDES